MANLEIPRSAPEVKSTAQLLKPTAVQNTSSITPSKELAPGKSHSACPLNDANAVVTLGKIINLPNAKWTFPAGEEFAKRFPELKESIEKGDYAKFLEAVGGKGNEGRDAVNKFLKEKGFSIEFKGNYSPSDTLVASTFKQHVDWKVVGANGKIMIDDPSAPEKKTEYQAVVMASRQHAAKGGYQIYNIGGRDTIVLNCKDGSKVYITKKMSGDKNEPESTFKLAENITDSVKNGKAEKKTFHFDKIYFPKVDYSKSGTLDHLVGAKAGGTTVVEALYEHRLKMDEKGATAEAASALRGSKGVTMDPDLRIDGPFHVWFTNSNDKVTFSATIDKDSMIKVKE